MATDLNSAMFVKPIIEGFLTGKASSPKIAWVKLSDDIGKSHRPGMNLAVRVRLSFDDDHRLCANVIEMTPPVLKGCAEADGILVVPAGDEGIPAGTMVPIEINS